MDVLPSWKDGELKRSIVQFVESVTNPNSNTYVPPEKRLATFDHDGTLFVEKPLNAQVAFIKQTILNRKVKQKPSLMRRAFEKFDNGYAKRCDKLLSAFKRMLKLTRRKVSPQQFRLAVNQWICNAVHPRFKCSYPNLVYRPMRELLMYLHNNDFDIYIVTGASTDFIRPWSEKAYKIDNRHILGSDLTTGLSEDKSGNLQLILQPIPFLFGIGANKVRAIERMIAEQPIFSFGNSRGDMHMLRWTSQAANSFCGLIHHTDDVREYKYSPDPTFFVGESMLSKANRYRWNVVDMKNDWLKVF